jgi:hypothetical protein
MTAQPKLFDDIGQIPVSQPTQSPQEAKRKAIQRVSEAANEEWMEAAGAIVEKLAMGSRSFTTDDVWAELDSKSVSTHERRAMGAVMTKAAKANLIEASGSYKPSTRPACNHRPIAVWNSLVFGGDL